MLLLVLGSAEIHFWVLRVNKSRKQRRGEVKWRSMIESRKVTYPRTACHLPCSPACRCSCRTWECSGRGRQCGSRPNPLHTRLHLHKKISTQSELSPSGFNEVFWCFRTHTELMLLHFQYELHAVMYTSFEFRKKHWCWIGTLTAWAIRICNRREKAALVHPLDGAVS